MEIHLIFSKCLVPTTKQKRGSFTPAQAERQFELWLHSLPAAFPPLVLARILWGAQIPIPVLPRAAVRFFPPITRGCFCRSVKCHRGVFGWHRIPNSWRSIFPPPEELPRCLP